MLSIGIFQNFLIWKKEIIIISKNYRITWDALANGVNGCLGWRCVIFLFYGGGQYFPHALLQPDCIAICRIGRLLCSQQPKHKRFVYCIQLLYFSLSMGYSLLPLMRILLSLEFLFLGSFVLVFLLSSPLIIQKTGWRSCPPVVSVNSCLYRCRWWENKGILICWYLYVYLY